MSGELYSVNGGRLTLMLQCICTNNSSAVFVGWVDVEGLWHFCFLQEYTDKIRAVMAKQRVTRPRCFSAHDSVLRHEIITPPLPPLKSQRTVSEQYC